VMLCIKVSCSEGIEQFLSVQAAEKTFDVKAFGSSFGCVFSASF
jgi:hypothetical protein